MTGTWLTGWATGDVVTAAEYRKSIGSIFDTTLGATAATIDVPSIPQTYAHLLVTLYARGDTASTTTPCLIRLNGDSSANYDSELLYGTAATSVASEAIALAGLYACTMPAASVAAGLFAAAQLFIPHYAGSVNQKAFASINSSRIGITTGTIRCELMAGGWRSTSAINRLTFLPLAGNFVAGTRVTVHAMGA